MSHKENTEYDTERRQGYVSLKAVHFWLPFIFQLAVLMGGWFTLQQKVTDMQSQIELQRLDSQRQALQLETQIIELRAHLYRP